jgi:hypothetical protein
VRHLHGRTQACLLFSYFAWVLIIFSYFRMLNYVIVLFACIVDHVYHVVLGGIIILCDYGYQFMDYLLWSPIAVTHI